MSSKPASAVCSKTTLFSKSSKGDGIGDTLFGASTLVGEDDVRGMAGENSSLNDKDDIMLSDNIKCGESFTSIYTS